MRQIRTDYSQSKTDEASSYAYVLRVIYAPKDMQAALAVDFLLAQNDLQPELLGARIIIQTIQQGAVIEASKRQRAVTELKDDLSRLNGKGQESFDFAMEATNALMLLGDDAGLDILLTSKEIARNYCVLDNWDTTSDPSVFEQLVAKFDKKAAEPSNKNPDPYRIKAATYRLCVVRRQEGKGIVPLHPLINLDELRSR